MQPIAFHCTVDATAAHADVIDTGLHAFNQQAADLDAVKRFCVYARDASGQMLGGVLARWWGTACEVQQLWVEESRRGQGIGAALMREAEQAARERGCNLVYLETFSFQAEPFYTKAGYAVACRLDGFPDGGAKFIMKKQLG